MNAEQEERKDENDFKPTARPCHGGMGAFGMTADEMKAWRLRLGLTQAQAGAAIGMSRHWIKAVEGGRRRAGRVHGLACAQYESIALPSGGVVLQPGQSTATISIPNSIWSLNNDD